MGQRTSSGLPVRNCALLLVFIFNVLFQVSLWRIMKANAKEWWIILLGLLGAFINGSIWPLFSLLFGEILEVFARPADQILSGTHLWAGLFIVLGIVSGGGVFLKVCCAVCQLYFFFTVFFFCSRRFVLSFLVRT